MKHNFQQRAKILLSFNGTFLLNAKNPITHLSPLHSSLAKQAMEKAWGRTPNFFQIKITPAILHADQIFFTRSIILVQLTDSSKLFLKECQLLLTEHQFTSNLRSLLVLNKRLNLTLHLKRVLALHDPINLHKKNNLQLFCT